MANRQTYVIGALGVLVGMVVASSAQRAQTVSFAGHNPNSEVIRDMPHLRRAAGYWRQRSEEEALGSVFGGTYYRITAPRRSSIADNVENRLERRLGDATVFSAAPTQTVLGVPAILREAVEGCSMLTRQRYSRCIKAAANGEPYEPTYWPFEYNN